MTIDGKTEKFETVQFNIEHYKIHGGFGTRFKGSPQDVVQDSKYLEREKHQFKAYLKAITDKVNDSSEIVLFGPAKTNERFAKTLQENNDTLAMKIKAVKKADSMTDNRIKAWVRDFFASSQ
ncbi:hypothetical protein [Psychroflexus aurantiacus]|uniref:hypothetical protein n=1 Tax=Psychroflexus aurantiacus TaxID=2709310 RepID=UPI0019688779|nr:hypothetical protein [Psychroflexus aurantiacus]